MMPKGAWMKSSRNGRTSTALCPADVSEVGGAACYNDARVEVERVELPESGYVVAHDHDLPKL